MYLIVMMSSNKDEKRINTKATKELISHANFSDFNTI